VTVALPSLVPGTVPQAALLRPVDNELVWLTKRQP
jgi:hypothetical protein